MSVVSTPVFSKDRLLISGLMLKLQDDKPSASVLWPETAKGRVLSSTSTPLLQEDCIFSADSSGKLVSLETRTGKRLWETNSVTDAKGGASTSIHLTAQSGSVLLYNDLGELIRARLTAQGYEEVSRVQLIEPSYPFSGGKHAWSAPA